MLLTYSVAHRLAHQAQRQGRSSASWRSAAICVRLLGIHSCIGHAGHRQGMHRADLSWQRGLRGDVGVAVMPTPCSWAGFT